MNTAMATNRANRLPEMSPWRRHPLTIPPDSFDAWARLAVWECWMGMLVYGAVSVAAHLIATAPDSITSTGIARRMATIAIAPATG